MKQPNKQAQLEENFQRPVPIDDAIKFWGPEAVLKKGRWIETGRHDAESCRSGQHMHMYVGILETYNPKTKTVLLSKEGSRRLRENLSTPDRAYSLDEVFEKWYFGLIRPKNCDLF